jgi:hypothetical protein
MMKTDWIVIRQPLHPPPVWGDCYAWCIDTWGLNNEWVYVNLGEFHFKHEQDAMLFKLRWS